MSVKTCGVDEFQQRLKEWRGGPASFNAYRDDHDRLILKLAHPMAQQEPVGLAFFYCTYVAGPTSWHAADLVVREAAREDGSLGYEACDSVAGLVVRFASASLYGHEEAVLPERNSK
ncbi:hypothetical protein [Piscinibacter gummiphilus]|uniref:hypothetical protein n=1 Tax=Piscinibacter gummiphilus TaxID=946333 RepID=UPI0012F4C762|nr:hypothetical protein [Piscinibacter gummiphilus]